MTLALELFPRRVDPEVFARAQVGRFTGHQLRIGRSRVVPAVAFRSWLGDLTLPVPACHQGWSGFAAAGDLLATSDPVPEVRDARRAGSRGGGANRVVPGRAARPALAMARRRRGRPHSCPDSSVLMMRTSAAERTPSRGR
ncbi:hypothetical protein GCM10009629_51620 [Pseudonocardia alni]